MYGTSVVHLPRRVRWHRKLERHAAFRVGRRVDVRAADRVPDLRAGGGSGLVHIISLARRERLHRYQPIRASASSRTWDIRIPVTGRSRGAIHLKHGTVANRSAPNGSGLLPLELNSPFPVAFHRASLPFPSHLHARRPETLL